MSITPSHGKKTKDLNMDNKTESSKTKYNFNRTLAIISSGVHGTFDKYEYLTGQNVSPSSQHLLIQQESFKFLHWVQQFSKQTKATAE